MLTLVLIFWYRILVLGQVWKSALCDVTRTCDFLDLGAAKLQVLTAPLCLPPSARVGSPASFLTGSQRPAEEFEPHVPCNCLKIRTEPDKKGQQDLFSIIFVIIPLRTGGHVVPLYPPRNC